MLKCLLSKSYYLILPSSGEMGVESGVRRWEREDGELFCCELKTRI